MSSLDTPFSTHLEAREEEMKIKKITSSNNRRLLKSSSPANHQTDDNEENTLVPSSADQLKEPCVKRIA